MPLAILKRPHNGGNTPLTLSLSPCNGERVAEGRERGSSANPPIIIGNRSEWPGILHSAFPSSVAALRRVDCPLHSLRLALGWLCWRFVGALLEPCWRIRVALGSQSVGYQQALRWLWGRIGRLAREPPECVIFTHSGLVVFDLGPGSGYFSFTEKPDLLPYQVFLVFRKGT